jgi:dephospho-CoA kinase
LADQPFFIGFAGRIGSGKTSAAQYLAAKYEFQYIRYSQVLQDWIDLADAGKSRLQEVGWEVMNGGMQLELNSRLITRLDRSRSAAIDGLRHEVDYTSLSAAFTPYFSLIFMKSSEGKRFERLQSRFSGFAAFEAADVQPVESRIENLRSLAVKTILNDGSLERLYDQLDTLVATLK